MPMDVASTSHTSPSARDSATPSTDGPQASSSSKRSSSLTDQGSRKRARKDGVDDEPSRGSEHEKSQLKAPRGARACTACRRVKMKCVGADDGPPCKRCKTGKHECVFEESNRGKHAVRKAELIDALHKMEKNLDTVLRSIIHPTTTSAMVSRTPSPSPQTNVMQALLVPPPSPPPSDAPPESRSPKLHSLPDNTLNPIGLIAAESLAHSRGSSRISSLETDSNEDTKRGVASDKYFRPGPMANLPLRRLYIERQVQPEMLNFVSADEVTALFGIYFDMLDIHCYLLDRNLHTPSLVCSRSPFLLTTICAIASKFYPARPELHGKLTELAHDLAFDVPKRGRKTVEIVQAYLLLTLWGCGAAERYEEDKTWTLLGMGIRTATDLNLHRKTAVTHRDTPEGREREREVRNRERTWIVCFVLDRTFSAGLGKPYTLREDSIIRNVANWYHGPSALKGDACLAAYTDLQCILSRSLDLIYSGTRHPSGLQDNLDYMATIRSIEAQILAASFDWFHNRGLSALGDDAVGRYATLFNEFYLNYEMLVLNSFGLQNALDRAPLEIGHFFTRTYVSAKNCATLVRDKLGPSGLLRSSPDAHFVQISYAVLTLLKLLRPELRPYMEDEAMTIELVRSVAEVLNSVAVDTHHTPALYSTFLRALITAKTNLAPSPLPLSRTSPATDVPAATPPLSTSISESLLTEPFEGLDAFQLSGDFGAAADMSCFPLSAVPFPVSSDNSNGNMISMDSILNNDFWDSVLMPGYSNSMDGLSGGTVFGAGGSGLITPRKRSPELEQEAIQQVTDAPVDKSSDGLW